MLTHDVVLTVAVWLAFASFVTVHVALAAGLIARKPRWQGAVSLVIVPLAPVFGFSQRLRVRSVLWIALAVAYTFALWRASV